MKQEVLDRRRQEAIDRGCEYMGNALGIYKDEYQYALYKLPCGHEQDVKRVHFMKGKFRCRQCLINKYESEALAAGVELIDHRPIENDADYKKYKLKCGHEKVFAYYNIDKCAIFCDECDFQQRHESAARNGLVLLNYSDTSKHMRREYMFVDCGHTQIIPMQRLTRNEVPVCYQCRENRWAREILEAGLELLSDIPVKFDKYKIKHLYKLPCGCSKLITRGDVRRKNFGCDNHSTYWNKPSVLYILTIKSLGFTWIKMGVTSNLQKRVADYKMYHQYEVLDERTFHFNSLADATKIEKALHKKYRHLRLNPKAMKHYMENGTTECYSVDHFNLLLSEMEKL